MTLPAPDLTTIAAEQSPSMLLAAVTGKGGGEL